MKPKIIISESRKAEIKIEYINRHNRIVDTFNDVDCEAGDARSILEFIDLLKKDGISLDIEVIDKRV